MTHSFHFGFTSNPFLSHGVSVDELSHPMMVVPRAIKPTLTVRELTVHNDTATPVSFWMGIPGNKIEAPLEPDEHFSTRIFHNARIHVSFGLNEDTTGMIPLFCALPHEEAHSLALSVSQIGQKVCEMASVRLFGSFRKGTLFHGASAHHALLALDSRSSYVEEKPGHLLVTVQTLEFINDTENPISIHSNPPLSLKPGEKGALDFVYNFAYTWTVHLGESQSEIHFSPRPAPILPNPISIKITDLQRGTRLSTLELKERDYTPPLLAFDLSIQKGESPWSLWAQKRLKGDSLAFRKLEDYTGYERGFSTSPLVSSRRVRVFNNTAGTLDVTLRALHCLKELGSLCTGALSDFTRVVANFDPIIEISMLDPLTNIQTVKRVLLKNPDDKVIIPLQQIHESSLQGV